MSSSSEVRSPVELLADEFLARHKRGEKPTIKEYCDRHPDLADEIRDVFEAVLMVEDLKPGSGDVSGSVGESLTVNGKRLAQVGDYRILCEIGRGGMGVVYEAEQQALGRRVALKVLPRTIAGDGSAQIRFQREAKAAARMHHTNIVPVFDVGQDGDHLYYAMQLIHGQGLDLVIDDLKRLRAKSTAAPATDRGAGERSIAASLVAGRFEQENLAVPEDTGVTAAFEGSAPSSAMLPGRSDLSTATSNRGSYFRSVAQIGLQTAAALSYAHGRGIIHRDIKPGNLILDSAGNVWVTDFGLAKTGDTAMTHTGDILGTIRYMSPERFRGHCDVRADVYALGMTLYEMLTLKAAYASGDRLKLIELIRQTEATNPRSVDARIPRDLETIVMKAIDKDPKRRYQSADEMAEDLQRFVNDEPIKARRVGQVERFSRWCRRHPAVAGLLATVLLLMATGTTVSTWQAVVATRARAELAKKNAELAAEQDKVQARFDTAVKAIETFHTGVSEDMLLKNPEFKKLRTTLLKHAAGFYAELDKLLTGQTDAKSRKTLAKGYSQLADLTAKIGDQAQALELHRKALAVRRELAAEPGADVETHLDLARSLESAGGLLLGTGDVTGARKLLEEQRDLAERMEAHDPTEDGKVLLTHAHDMISGILIGEGKFSEAMESRAKGLGLYRKLADANPANGRFRQWQAGTYAVTAWWLVERGKAAEALEPLHKALAIMQALVDGDNANADYQDYLAHVHNNIGYAQMELGRSEEALEAYRKALAVRRELVDTNRAVTDYQVNLVFALNNIGADTHRAGNPVKALEPLREALSIQQKLAEANPAVVNYQQNLAWIQNRIGESLLVTGKPAEALQAYRSGLALYQKVSPPNFQWGVGWSQNLIGEGTLVMGNSAEALEWFRKSMPSREQMVKDNPGNMDFEIDLTITHYNIGRAQARLKRFDEAFIAFDRSLSVYQKLAEADPKNNSYRVGLGMSHAYRGGARVHAGQPAQGAADLRRALELWAKAPYLSVESQLERSRALALLAGLGADAKSGVTAAEATALADRSVAALTAIVKTGWALPSELKEPDFDALRGRADFQKLVAEVGAKVEKK